MARGELVSIPMNAWHEHHNASGLEAARYIAMTSAPRVIDTFNNYEFVFENPFVFRDRYNAEEGSSNKRPQRSSGRPTLSPTCACAKPIPAASTGAAAPRARSFAWSTTRSNRTFHSGASARTRKRIVTDPAFMS